MFIYCFVVPHSGDKWLVAKRAPILTSASYAEYVHAAGAGEFAEESSDTERDNAERGSTELCGTERGDTERGGTEGVDTEGGRTWAPASVSEALPFERKPNAGELAL